MAVPPSVSGSGSWVAPGSSYAAGSASIVYNQADRPQIIFALVSRGPHDVLAEYTALTGNFEQATRQFLQKLCPTTEWKSYIYGEQALHYIIDGELWFTCMAD